MVRYARPASTATSTIPHDHVSTRSPLYAFPLNTCAVLGGHGRAGQPCLVGRRHTQRSHLGGRIRRGAAALVQKALHATMAKHCGHAEVGDLQVTCSPPGEPGIG